MQASFKNRLYFFSILFLLVFGAVIIRILIIQTSEQASLFKKMGDQSLWKTITIKPERGKIYDRNGNMLAGNVTVYEIGIDFSKVEDLDGLVMTLSNVLDIPYAELSAFFADRSENQVYMSIKNTFSYEQGRILEDMYSAWWEDQTSKPNMAGLDVRSRMGRSYPNQDLSSTILGFVHTNEVAAYGVEFKYDSILAGIPINVQRPNDPTLATGYTIPPRGSDLILTIDREIQLMVEETLAQYTEELDALSGTMIIINPKNGEILAMASTPQIDLNDTSKYLEVINNLTNYNRAISVQYEPGSIFKILTMAAALDSGIVTPGTTYLDTGYFEINGVNIFNWDRGAWGVQDMTGCLQNSLNVCMARLSVTMGPETFYDYLNRFGIGRPTGVDVGVEAYGMVPDPNSDTWLPIDMGTNSFGQSVAVTPIQIVTAISAVANDGKMVAPHIVKSIVTNGQQTDIPVQVLGQPIRPETAHTLSAMLAEAMDRNESVARLEGYTLATKTGTASIPRDYGYDPNITNQSFVGWGPIDDPKFLVYMWFEEPTAQEWASVALSPVFKEVVSKLVVYLDLPPDNIRLGQVQSQN